MGVMLSTDRHAERIRRERGMGSALTDGAGRVVGCVGREGLGRSRAFWLRAGGMMQVVSNACSGRFQHGGMVWPGRLRLLTARQLV